MLSRVADNLYWFGRYLQRAEGTARLINVNSNLLLDLPRRVPLGWHPLIEIFDAQAEFARLYDEPSESNVVRFLIIDERNPGSILASIKHAREILRQSRDVMPRETWERINDLFLLVKAQGERACQRRYRAEVLTQVINASMVLSGIVLASMSRDVGFSFMRLGNNIEQADITTRIVDTRSANLIQPRHADELRPFQAIQWMSVLKSLTGYQMYRRHVRVRVSGPSVLGFLIQDTAFPRSVRFCLLRVERELPKLPTVSGVRDVERALARLSARVSDADMNQLVEQGLHKFLDEVQAGLNELSNTISATYFRFDGGTAQRQSQSA